MPKPIDIKDLLVAGVHFGHKSSRWAPRMRPYIWGVKNKIHLIDVSKTAFLLERAGAYLQHHAAQGAQFLFIGTKKAAQDLIRKTASDLGMPFVVHRWLGGTLSNFDQIKKAMTRLLHLSDVIAKPVSNYTKKERVGIQKEIERLDKNVGGMLELRYPPAAVIVVDAKKEQSAVKEAARLGIPVISIVDTNTNPEGVNFVIPANDDSPKSIAYILNYLKASIEEGMVVAREEQSKKAEERAARAKHTAEAAAEKRVAKKTTKEEVSAPEA